ncbi:MAG: cupin domain-containing protein [Acidobacteriota bacterium]
MTHDPGRADAPAVFDFARLIASIDERTFFDQYWEQRPLVLSRGAADYYAGLCSIGDVDRILTAADLRYPSLRLIRNGPDLPLDAFTHDVRSRRFTFTGVCDVERVLAEYQGGATILLQRLDRSWPALGALCRNLEERFFHAADANVYLTPKAAQGFGAHYDTHDVFVLQIAGTKHWRLHDAPLRLPLESQPFDGRAITPGPCVQELDVHPGDLIYLPRGTIHSALTSDTSSLHVTVGVTPQTWTDVLLAAVLARAGTDDRLREAVPLSAGTGADGADLQQRFAGLLASVAAGIEVASVLAALQARFVAERRPRLEGRLVEIETPQTPGLSTRVARRSGLIYRIALADGKAVLSFHTTTIAYPAHLEAALRYVSEGSAVDVSAIPGELDVLQRMLFVQRLVKEGFLVGQP